MADDDSTLPEPAESKPRWQPIGAIDRRVAGVLVEKAKTTPDAYPLSLNAIRTACNQKSNRSPVMQLEAEDVEESLQRLRGLGAVGVIEGYGRVAKYRHYLYEWLGADKVELAVMAELLLRGPQTEGELRGRAARMEPIADLTALRPVLTSLKSKGLVIPLTPEGRGHVVTHGLHQPRELENLAAGYGRHPAVVAPAAGEVAEVPSPAGDVSPPPVPSSATAAPQDSVTDAVEPKIVHALRSEINELRLQVAQLRSDLDELSVRQSQADVELHELRSALGG